MISLWDSAGQLVTVGAHEVMVAVVVSKRVMVDCASVGAAVVALLHSRRSITWPLTPAARAAAKANLVNMAVGQAMSVLIESADGSQFRDGGLK